MSDEKKTPPEMTPLDPVEKCRTYHFPDGKKLVVGPVVAICIRLSGTHRLKGADGKLWIVPAGWLGVEIEADGWTL